MSRRAGIPTPTERRARVRALAGTHTRSELVEALGVSRATIDLDLKALGLHAKRGTTARPDLLARRDERRAKLRELAATHTRRELSLLLDVGPQALAADLKALGLTAKRAPSGPAPRSGQPQTPPPRLQPDTPQTPSPRVGPRPQARYCERHPGVRIGAWGCRACNAQRDAGGEGVAA